MKLLFSLINSFYKSNKNEQTWQRTTLHRKNQQHIEGGFLSPITYVPFLQKFRFDQRDRKNEFLKTVKRLEKCAPMFLRPQQTQACMLHSP